MKTTKLNSLNFSKENIFYLVAIAFFIILSYSVYFIFDETTVRQLGKEDGLFEYLTALFFFIASILFFLKFIRNWNLFFILLSIVFLFGSGEEISWGQRIIGFGTPSYISDKNVQKEFTLHNIEVFNAQDFDNNIKTGFDKLLTINFIYKMFWLTYCILIPLSVLYFHPARWVTQKVNLPIPPLSVGMFFLINWLTFRMLLSFILPANKPLHYYIAVGEIYECVSGFIFMLISLYFFKRNEV